MSLISCGRKHYTKNHPWQPKRKKTLDRRYEHCPR